MKTPLSKLLALFFMLSLAVLISVLTLMWGWGLTPKSWTAIILLGVFGNMFVQIFIKLIEKE